LQNLIAAKLPLATGSGSSTLEIEGACGRSATQRSFCLATTIPMTALPSVTASGAEPSRLILKIDGPTVIGVFPPVSQAKIDHDDGGSEKQWLTSSSPSRTL
jgi:hypothetical protein